MATSYCALKLPFNYCHPLTNFVELYSMAKRATPNMFTNYKCAALVFYKIYNSYNL